MARGRPPKPVELKRLTGNPGHRPLPTAVLVLPSAQDRIPAIPHGLGKEGRKVWRRLWTSGGAWLSPELDVDLLRRLCEAHDEREQLRQRVERDGPFITGAK